MSRDDLYERYLSEAERFLKSEASSAQLVKQECDRWDRESTSAKNMAGKKKGSVRPGLTYICPHGAISLAP